MAIGPIQGSLYYDVNREMYYGQQEMYEREMQYRRHQEEGYRRMQNAAYFAPEQKLIPKPDTKDPLSFLSKADTKILLTGEAT